MLIAFETLVSYACAYGRKYVNGQCRADGRRTIERTNEPYAYRTHKQYILIQSNADNLIQCPVNNVIN